MQSEAEFSVARNCSRGLKRSFQSHWWCNPYIGMTDAAWDGVFSPRNLPQEESGVVFSPTDGVIHISGWQMQPEMEFSVPRIYSIGLRRSVHWWCNPYRDDRSSLRRCFLSQEIAVHWPFSERPFSERPISERPISERPISEGDHSPNDHSPKATILRTTNLREQPILGRLIIVKPFQNFYTFSRIFSLCCTWFFIFTTGDRYLIYIWIELWLNLGLAPGL
jgi:hypothetical protein